MNIELWLQRVFPMRHLQAGIEIIMPDVERYLFDLYGLAALELMGPGSVDFGYRRLIY